MRKQLRFEPQTDDEWLFFNDAFIGAAPTPVTGMARLDALAYQHATHANRTLPDPAVLWAEYRATPDAFYARLQALTAAQLTAFAISFAAYAAYDLGCPAMPNDFLRIWRQRLAERNQNSVACNPLDLPTEPPTEEGYLYAHHDHPR